MSSTGLIIKTINACNLSCSYCDADIYSKNQMSFETLAHMTFKAMKDKVNHVSFMWHGGEPLLRGLDFYKKAVFLQQKYSRVGQTVENGVQTNGTLLNHKWIDFFKNSY